MGMRSCTGLPRVMLARPVAAGAKEVSSFLAFTGEAAGGGSGAGRAGRRPCVQWVDWRLMWLRGRHGWTGELAMPRPTARPPSRVAVGGARGALPRQPPDIPTLCPLQHRGKQETPLARFDLYPKEGQRCSATVAAGYSDPSESGSQVWTPAPTRARCGGQGGHPAHASPCSIPEGLATALRPAVVASQRVLGPDPARRAAPPGPPCMPSAGVAAAPSAPSTQSHHAATPCQRPCPSRRPLKAEVDTARRGRGAPPPAAGAPELRPAAAGGSERGRGGKSSGGGEGTSPGLAGAQGRKRFGPFGR
nr:uncharacterized protein LOC127323324 [Lolium perenne]